MNWLKKRYRKIIDWLKPLFGRFKIKLKKHLPFIFVTVLIFLFFFFYLFNSIVYTVHSGEGGVLFKRFFGGTVVDKVYSEGLHLIFPWDKMYIYNMRTQQISQDFSVLTKNGLRINLKISIRYLPERNLLGVLHKFVGPQYAQIVIIPEVEHVLRVVIGKMSAEDVYTTKRSVVEKYLNDAVENVHRRFIKVDNVIIKNIILPPKVESIIQYKIEQKHLAEAVKFKIERQKKEKIRKRIEGEAMRDYNNIVNTSLSPDILQWMAIQASLELAKSENTKVVVVGSGKRGLPIFGNMVLDAPGILNSPPEQTETSAEPGKEKPTDLMEKMDQEDTMTMDTQDTASVDAGEKNSPLSTTKPSVSDPPPTPDTPDGKR